MPSLVTVAPLFIVGSKSVNNVKLVREFILTSAVKTENFYWKKNII